MNDPGEQLPGKTGAENPQGGEAEDVALGFWGKLVLTAFPFLLVFLFLILEWWIRGRP